MEEGKRGEEMDDLEIRKVFNMLPEMVFVIDEEAIIRGVNEYGAETLGYSVEELVGKYAPSIFYLDDREAVSRQFKMCIENPGKIFNWRLRKIKKDGMVIWVGEWARCIVDNGKKLVLVVCEDITKIIESEKELRESKEKYRSLFELSNDGVLVVDPKKKIYVKCNSAALRIIGAKEEDFIIGKHPADISPLKQPDGRLSREKAEEFIEKALYDGTASFDWVKLACDGKLIFLNIFLTKIKQGGEDLVYVSWRDITDKKKLEEQFLQSQKMDAIGKLAGGVAHDFNNILSVILGYGQLLQMRYSDGSSEGRKIGEIIKAAQRGARLTQSLLAFTRKEALQLKPVNINSAIKEMEKMIRRLLTEDVELFIELSQDDVVANSDLTQITQVIINLVTNAKDALTGKGGLIKVSVGTSFINPRLADDPRMIGKYCVISVSDNGLGMDESTKDKIFDPFFTTKEAGKGTGLGLSTVYGIVKQHNGFLEVDSSLGVGSEFKIYLPVVSEFVEKEEMEVRKITGGNEKILLAEDNETVRKMNSLILRKFGYEVVEAVDGEEAIEKFFGNSNIRLVISDVIMPKKNGREVYETIKSSQEGEDIKFLFISGYTQDVLSERGMEGIEVECLNKPVSPEELLASVRRILD